LSLDLGVKKMAYCLFDTEKKQIIDWTRVDLADAGKLTFLAPTMCGVCFFFQTIFICQLLL
jgi:hypothetical protein